MGLFSKIGRLFGIGRKSDRTEKRLGSVLAGDRQKQAATDESRRRALGLRQVRADRRLESVTKADQARVTREADRKADALRRRQDQAGNRLTRQLAADQVDRDRRERAEQERQERDPEYRFVYKGEGVDTPQSSNVSHIQYSIKEAILYIRFHDGSLYSYFNIHVQEARSLYVSGSKGGWCWDNLRVRGSRLGHRKDYALVAEGHRGQRKWNMSAGLARRHGGKVARQSGVKMFESTTKRERSVPVTNRSNKVPMKLLPKKRGRRAV